MNTYQTTEVARIIGVHPNTVRLYEQLHLIPLAKRQKKWISHFYGFSHRAISFSPYSFKS